MYVCMVWYGMVWYGMVWYGMVWYGMVWYVCMYVCMCVHIYIYIYIYIYTYIYTYTYTYIYIIILWFINNGIWWLVMTPKKSLTPCGVKPHPGPEKNHATGAVGTLFPSNEWLLSWSRWHQRLLEKWKVDQGTHGHLYYRETMGNHQII